MTDYESDPSSMSGDTLDKLDDASRRSEELTGRLRDLQSGANGFARAMSRAFSSAVVGGKQFDDVLRSLVLRMSDMAVRMAFKPLGGSPEAFKALADSERAQWGAVVKASGARVD